jgi:hypothetical protein
MGWPRLTARATGSSHVSVRMLQTVRFVEARTFRRGRGRDRVVDLRRGGEDDTKMDFKQGMPMWTGSIWLRICTSGEFL